MIAIRPITKAQAQVDFAPAHAHLATPTGAWWDVYSPHNNPFGDLLVIDSNNENIWAYTTTRKAYDAGYYASPAVSAFELPGDAYPCLATAEVAAAAVALHAAALRGDYTATVPARSNLRQAIKNAAKVRWADWSKFLAIDAQGGVDVHWYIPSSIVNIPLCQKNAVIDAADLADLTETLEFQALVNTLVSTNRKYLETNSEAQAVLFSASIKLLKDLLFENCRWWQFDY